ncbi:alcohol dehydrogenase AdhP [Paenibacillus zeisoli]|uniref:Alcohol dehydrogenase n=1 Tax=Paenibacillus zeisoli TaxID=2496267 RepID=A0A433XNL5_9BACL|nr:alcohol dehydrogenase AdhP [Paenibacillus zeisoli]RUT35691.1 alcohol dehydrogenase AdhP [Paenibacillus zeisoli]
MKAAVTKGFKDKLQIIEVEQPKPGPNQVLVQIKACGVCHTDLHAANGDWPVKPKLPLIPGHEGVGEITEVGQGVQHLKVGDRVGIPWLYSACGHCEFCLSGRETLCLEQHNSGYSVDGSFAEYCVAMADYVVKIPDNLSFKEAAPLFCAGVTTYKALKVSEARPGQWVSIVGIGGLGHLAVQYAKAMGLNVIAVDTFEEKLELAKSLGADLAFNPKEVNVEETVKERVGGVQASVVTAVTSKAFESAYNSLKRGGTLVLVGLPPEKMEIPIFNTVLDGTRIVGSIVGTRKDLQEALQFASEGKVKANIETRRLEDINEVFTEMQQGEIQGRIVLEIS